MNYSKNIINVSDLRKFFNSKCAVNDISLNINSGEIYGFLGANGSGKTTTLRMLCGLLTPDHGTGQCLGFDIIKQTHEIKRNIGYMAQRFSFYEELTVFENLKFIAQMYNISEYKDKIFDILKKFYLNDRKNDLAGTLSGGLKQKLALAASLLHEPKILLLDEPTAGVDPNARGEFWDAIQQLSNEGITTLVSTHYMDEAQRCSRLVYMSLGKILAQGTPKEIIEKTALSTYKITGENLFSLAKKIREQYDLQALMLGNTLQISSTSKDKIIESLNNFTNKFKFDFAEIETTLEDVFVHIMKKEYPA